MVSSPATSLVKLSASPPSGRFIDTGAPCEWAEDYRPGGFHPVNLGDRFSNDRYKVIRKLGNGSYSTVWLAVDTHVLRYVALKIMIADASTTSTELCILDHLSKLASADPKSKHVTTLLDRFEHHGPNGKHRCLVFEPMGPTVVSLVGELTENKPKVYGKRQRYPKWMAKKILVHTLRGLAFIHQNRVVHSDVQPGNLLFSIDDITALQEDELRQDEAATAVPLCRTDGKADIWAPQNLYLEQPLFDRVQLDSRLSVKLSDLGAAFWVDDPPGNTVTPLRLRAPELILHQPFGRGIDIWSFGCLMFELLTGRALFAVMMLGNDQKEQDDADDDHLIQLNDIVCSLPDSLIASWPRASKWYGPNRQRLQPYADGSHKDPYVHKPLTELFMENKPDEIGDEESAILIMLMKQILEYDPAKRPSAIDLLKHSWFS